MNDTATLDELNEPVITSPGTLLATHREEMGYTAEFVADKLHLRAQIIELLEADDYHNMAQPVFIKGYIRAYAKLLGIPADPLLESFHKLYGSETKFERALWQSQRQSNRAEYIIRGVTVGFAAIVIVAVAMWWRANKENEHIFSSNYQKIEKPASVLDDSDVNLTDLTKMRSLLSSSGEELTQGRESG